MHTLTEGTEQTKEAKRSPLSTDFPIARWDSKKSGDNSDPKLFCHRSDQVGTNKGLHALFATHHDPRPTHNQHNRHERLDKAQAAQHRANRHYSEEQQRYHC